MDRIKVSCKMYFVRGWDLNSESQNCRFRRGKPHADAGVAKTRVSPPLYEDHFGRRHNITPSYKYFNLLTNLTLGPT